MTDPGSALRYDVLVSDLTPVRDNPAPDGGQPPPAGSGGDPSPSASAQSRSS